jgi:3-oxoacyl-(acyl-carrier-protein) synthase/phosphopantetheinyl transferase/malonyl CoA-acyl carrier protein transacylase
MLNSFMKNETDIAIVGMSCIFPGAKDINSYWENIINKVDAITEVPANRIDQVFFDSDSKDIDRLFVNRGGFIDDFVDFDPIEFGIVPKVVQGTEPDQLLSLKMAYRALEDADVFKKKISLQNAGVIIGKGGYGGVEMAKLAEMIVGSEALVRSLRYFMPHLTEDDLRTVKKVFQKLRGNFSPDNVLGTVPNFTAALVANRLDFGGPAYTVDAACASSLIAIDNAVKELNLHRCDLVVAGAMHLGQNAVLWSVFSMLGALSRNQIVRPFDRRADGVLTGEGCGYVVLERLEDAIKNDQRIYAVIKGVGLSSDGANASLMSPSTTGQVKALKNAWRQTNLDMKNIGYIEAHGTATVLGDKVELETLREFFGYDDKLPRAGVGSVKSMIGHAMPAAGMAGFIKTTLALYHGKLPPTLHCEEPVNALQKTRFEPIVEAIDWDQTDLPRLAGVNAFGFGGANGHAILEAFNVNGHKAYKKLTSANTAEKVPNEEVILLARQSNEELIAALEKEDYSLGSGSHRLAIFEPSKERIQKAIKIIRIGSPWRNRMDIWYTNSPILENKGKLAFIFPGLDIPGLTSVQVGNFEEVADYFNLPKPQFTKFKEGIEVYLGLDESCRIIDAALKKLNIFPDVIAGHSVGEWTACYSAGMVDIETVKKLEQQSVSTIFKKNEGVFLFVGLGIKEINPLLEQNKRIYLSNDNCSHQVVLCGTSEDIEKFRSVLHKEQIINYVLPFSSGYHSPFAERYTDDVKKNLKEIISFKQPAFPIWSGITASPYPKDLKAVAQLHVDFMTKPVRFRELAENLYNDGINFFLQIGAGSAIGFINDTLKDKVIVTIGSGSTKRSALNQIKRVVAAMFVEGRQADISILNLKKTTVKKSKTKGLTKMLDLGMEILSMETILTTSKVPLLSTVSKETVKVSQPVFDALNESFNQINQAQKELFELLKQRKVNSNFSKQDTSAELVPKSNFIKGKTFSNKLEFSLEKFPELIDHCPFKKRSDTYDFSDDKEPVIPLTMFLQLFGEIVHELEPNRVISKFENINAFQFLWIKETIHAEVQSEWKSPDRIFLKIENYVSAEIVLADKFESAPSSFIKDLGEPLEIPIHASQIYKEGFMFHDFAYQGILSLDSMGSKGIRATITSGKGKGSLLDNAGQLIGLWYHLIKINSMPFPVKVQEIKFFDSMFQQDGNMECTCRYTEATEEFLFGDIELKRNGKLWVSIKGWQNRKSEIDGKLWNIIVDATENFLSSEIEPGIFFFEKTYKRVNSWFVIMNQYLNMQEKRYYESLTLIRQNPWMMGRVAAKDAIRSLIFKKRKLKVHPAIIIIKSDELGRPYVEGEQTENIKISISHKEECAVAAASDNDSIGIDIEVIKDRDKNFIEMVLNPEEIKLLPSLQNISEWVTRCWVAKEAYGKSMGDGLKGNPKNYIIKKIHNNELWINNKSIKTIKHKNFIVGWTQQKKKQQ